MFKVNIHNIYFLIVLILLISLSIFEVHYLLYLITFVVYYSKVSRKFVEVISYLLLIIAIATISSFFNKSILYDWIKDFAYFSRPILAVLAGYLISKKINNFKSFFKVILIISVIFAIIHILKIVFLVDFSTAAVSDVRRVGGISNEIEIFSLMILIASKKYKQLDVINNKFLKKTILILLSISFALYLSRTMIISLLIFLLAVYGYLKITSKGLKYASLIIISFGLFYIYLFNADIKRDQPGFESFLYKMKNAPAEIFSPAKSIDTKNHAKLWDRWRAYEAGMAINQLETYNSFVFGKGFGSLVDLKFAAPLGSENIRYIPTLHNGYVNILYKTGIIGVFIYLILLFSLYLFSYFKIKNTQKKIAANLVGGFAIHYLLTTLIVTGMYNIMEPYMFILGCLIFYSLQKEKSEETIENCNNRH